MTYLLNSTLCLGLFFAFYHFVLSYEKMHVFNRVYLIGSILLSAGIPLLSFTTGEMLPETLTEGDFLLQPIVFLQEKTASELDSWQQSGGLLRISYSLITAVLLFRFLRNILAIQKQINQNTKISYKNAQLVLLDKRILPYTFMQYIFLDKEAYDENKIEEDLLLHELAHVKQKHSVDLFFIELLKVFFWFNPIFYFYQKAI